MRLVLATAAVLSVLVVPVALGAGKPAVSFVKPSANATTGSKVQFVVKLTNFSLDPKDVGKQKKAGLGHLHFQMDGGKFDYPKYSGVNGKLAVMLGIQGTYSPSVTRAITYSNLPAGKHKLVVFLANNDHSPVGASATIHFTVR
jgi:hypothetical protein